jgi:hypothetical protein
MLSKFLLKNALYEPFKAYVNESHHGDKQLLKYMMKPHWTALIEDIAELDLVEGYTSAPSRT